MECTVIDQVEQFAVKSGLPFPGIDNSAQTPFAQFLAQSVVGDYSTPGGIDYNGSVAQQGEFLFSREMPGRVFPIASQRRVEGHGVSLTHQLLQGEVLLILLTPARAGRIADNDTRTQTPSPFDDDTPHVPFADHSERL